MADKKAFYITTTIPYVNAPPHIGFALEVVQADIVARYHEHFLEEEVFFNFGSDEHGVKIYRKAIEQGKDPQAYVDEYAAKFDALKKFLNLTYTAFTRTTDPHHKAAAQEFWRRCKAAGDIYKKDYQIKYCVGCELEKTDSELVDGKCPLHPNLEIELINEENYFFRWSKYQEQLVAFYNEHPDFLLPESRFNGIRKFVEGGLQDFSISRLKAKMPWGIPVPGDDEHIMYVWFDALVNYISALGWPEDEKNFEKFWGTKDHPNGVQFAGKDQIRQQAAMWQAMLMSTGLPHTKQILIHGFITSGGQKMSKSLGNVVDPIAIIEEYGSDALRYFLARHIHPFEDSDFTMDKFKEAYNADLANGLGNLTARIMQLAETHLEKGTIPEWNGLPEEYTTALDAFEFNKAVEYVWERISRLDRRITEEAPFKLVKTDPEAGKKLIFDLTQDLYRVAQLLYTFMPEANANIKTAIEENKKPETLFPRKD